MNDDTYLLRLPKELKQAALRRAHRMNLSLALVIRLLLERWLAGEFGTWPPGEGENSV